GWEQAHHVAGEGAVRGLETCVSAFGSGRIEFHHARCKVGTAGSYQAWCCRCRGRRAEWPPWPPNWGVIGEDFRPLGSRGISFGLGHHRHIKAQRPDPPLENDPPLSAAARG